MIFMPKNGKFIAYSVNGIEEDEISTLLFTNVILLRALRQYKTVPSTLDTKMNEFFINQIDLTQPETFALSMIPFNEWHDYISVIKDVNNS